MFCQKSNPDITGFEENYLFIENSKECTYLWTIHTHRQYIYIYIYIYTYIYIYKSGVLKSMIFRQLSLTEIRYTTRQENIIVFSLSLPITFRMLTL